MSNDLLNIIQEVLKKNKLKFDLSDKNKTISVGLKDGDNIVNILFQIIDDKIDSLALFLPHENQLKDLCNICNDFNETHISKLFFQKIGDKYYFVSELTYYLKIFNNEFLELWINSSLQIHFDVWQEVLNLKSIS